MDAGWIGLVAARTLDGGCTGARSVRFGYYGGSRCAVVLTTGAFNHILRREGAEDLKCWHANAPTWQLPPRRHRRYQRTLGRCHPRRASTNA